MIEEGRGQTLKKSFTNHRLTKRPDTKLEMLAHLNSINGFDLGF